MKKKEETKAIFAEDVIVRTEIDSRFRQRISLDELLELIIEALNIRIEHHYAEPAYHSFRRRGK